ncbi:MAG: 50S ribosomal protein L18 [candidate division WWE3 bacterium]|nr:50S ribosomal protein L18 [candidate division WWE3 bacterium]
MAAVTKRTNLERRKIRVRAKVWGSSESPRISVRRTNTRMIVQAINDDKAATLAYASDFDLTAAEQKKNKSERAELVGKLFGEKSIKAGIKSGVFDRNGYLYHGRVARLADGIRAAGLII